MTLDTVNSVAGRIAEHVNAHDLENVQVVLHGGEPLLAGHAYIETITDTLRAAIPAQVDFRVQTNGTLLTDTVLDTLVRQEIRVGVSLDGSASANDLHRRYASGRSSHSVVTRSLGRLRDRAPHLFAGVLSTVDLRNDPIETYESILEFAPPLIDFLLPHGNWTNLPPGRDPVRPDAPYGKWLTTIFDHWYSTPRPVTLIRMFNEIIHLMLGGQSRIETVGLASVGLIVINADGSLEQVDALRSAFNGAAVTGLNVHTNPFDAALAHPAIIARQIGVAGLSPICRECTLYHLCGGGMYAHRYRAGTGFLNPSVYCNDLTYLIQNIYRRVSSDVSRLALKGKEPS